MSKTEELLEEFLTRIEAGHPARHLIADAIVTAATEHAHSCEMQHAIMRLPKPPAEMGDGPDERIGHALDLLRPIDDEAICKRMHLKAYIVQREISSIEKNEGKLDDLEYCSACAQLDMKE